MASVLAARPRAEERLADVRQKLADKCGWMAEIFISMCIKLGMAVDLCLATNDADRMVRPCLFQTS
jgi:hypothetical protein